MGAGIVPVALINGTLYFLFGKEVYDGKWGEFGGGSKLGETKLDTAIREGCEELDGFFGSEYQLKKQVLNNLILSITELDGKHESYVFKTEYDDKLPYYFNNHHKFIKTQIPEHINNDKNGLFEKSEIRWFTKNDLIKNKKYFRIFYKPIVEYLISEHTYILNKSKEIKLNK